jgi:hypothetical protein
MLLVWNLMWSGVAYDQLQITYELLRFKSTKDVTVFDDFPMQELNRGYVESDNVKRYNGTCFNSSLWGDEVTFDFDYESSTLNVEYTGSLNNIKDKLSLTIKQIPLKRHNESRGFNYLNYKTLRFEFNKHGKAKIPIRLMKSKFDKDYPVELIFEAYGGSLRKDTLCKKMQITSLHVNNYHSYIQPQSYFANDILSDVNIHRFSKIQTFEEELAYIDLFFQKNELNKLNSTLPEIDESTIALLHASVDGTKADWPWMVSDYIRMPRIEEEIVMGLYGDVELEDLQHIERLIDTLRVVAPTLKISYSTNSDLVTLPIHFSKCTSEFSDLFNYCDAQGAWGYYYDVDTPMHGWIWVDAYLSHETRQSVLTHEIGHALGLDHNLCAYSVMSYSEFSDTKQNYFSHVDLMQLQAIYDPDLNPYKNLITNSDLIQHFDLSEEKVEQYKDDIASACHKYSSKYDFLIEMQKGENQKKGWKTES